MTIVRGIDVSRWQTVTDWSKVADAVDFVAIKATEGEHTFSKAWPEQWNDAGKVKILRGTYHFGHPENDPIKEARHYASTIKAAGWKSGEHLPPVLDIETTAGKGKAALTDWVLTFLNEVDKQLGLNEPWLRCGFYCNRDYYNNRMDGRRIHDGRWWWLAWWPDPEGPWPSKDGDMPEGAAIWQWTSQQRIPGIKENVDGDVARLEDLKKLAPKYFERPKSSSSSSSSSKGPAVNADTMELIEALLNTPVKLGSTANKLVGLESGSTRTVAQLLVGAFARAHKAQRDVAELKDREAPDIEAAVQEALTRLLNGEVTVNLTVNSPSIEE